MNKFKNQSRPLTNLHDFAKNKMKGEQKKLEASDFSVKRSQQSKFGLSTLLHFNNNSTISSIRSKIDSSKITFENPPFSVGAKLEIQELRSKRLELEKRWGKKQVKHHSITSKNQSLDSKQDEEIQNSLNESQVQVYSQSLQKTKYVKNQAKSHIQDRFILDLKNQIRADKGKQFISIIKGIFMKDFLITLKSYLEIINFRQKCRSNILKTVIQEWKELSTKSIERQQLRKLIVQKIKKRKILRELNSQSNIDDFKC